MIRKFFLQHLRVGKERVFAANHDKQSLYYEKTLSSKAIPIVAKIVVGLGGISVCILPAVWYWMLFEEHYKQKFVTDADMRPYRISPPPYPLQAEVFREYVIRNQTQMDAAEKYVTKVYEERKSKISWRVKFSFAKAAHCQACVSLKSVYFAFLEDSKEDSKGLDNVMRSLTETMLFFYFTREEKKLVEIFPTDREVHKQDEEEGK